MNFNKRKTKLGCLFVLIVMLVGCFLITQIYCIPLPTGFPPRQITLITDDLPQNQNPQPTRIQLWLDINCQSGITCLHIPEEACVVQSNSHNSMEVGNLMWELQERAWFTVDGRPFPPYMYPSSSVIGTNYFSFFRCFTLQSLPTGEHLITYEASSTTGERFVQAWQILIEQ